MTLPIHINGFFLDNSFNLKFLAIKYYKHEFFNVTLHSLCHLQNISCDSGLGWQNLKGVRLKTTRSS